MHAYDRSKKPAAAAGVETKRGKPRDSIEMDMLEAERLGYGVHYGQYKVDHPHTKEANEAKLHPKNKQQPQVEKPRKVYEKVCPVCGKTFTTLCNMRVYCGDVCKWKNDGIRYREKKQREEALRNV